MSPGTETRSKQRRALWFALIANAAFLGVEIAGGFAFKSIALLADAAHMLSDVAGLSIALVAHALSTRSGSSRHTYGYQRAEVLGAQANGILLLAVSAWISVEAVGRFQRPEDVSGVGMTLVAVAGLGVNIASAIVVARARGGSVNMKGAFLHLATDSASSGIAVIAGIAVAVTGNSRFDPAASLIITAGVIWASLHLLREVSGILLEAAPRGFSLESVEAALASASGVESVHHIHVWNLASDVPALSAHVVISGDPSLHDAQVMGDDLRQMLGDRFGIAHATLELECHECEDQP